MKAKWFVSLSVFVVVLTAGCATSGRDLAHDGIIEIEKVSTRQVTITFVQVIQEDSQVEVRGKVQRKAFGRSPIPGHIDMELIGPDGAVLEKASIDFYRRNAKLRYAQFHGTLETIPPTGSTLKVMHDVDSHPASGTM